MPRILRYKSADEAAAAEAAAALERFAGVDTKRKRRVQPIDLDRARVEIADMRNRQSFDAARPLHMVALYEWCHEQVYGVRPAELSTKATWRAAMFAAGRLMQDEFRGSPVALVDFIRWTWVREKQREKQRRHDPACAMGRIGWRLQFVTKHLVTDYRISIAREGARG